MLVPDAAIGTDQARKFVLVVDTDGTVHQKFVTLGQAIGPLRVVKDGISPEDSVVINGLMRARPGQKVAPQEQGVPEAGRGQASADAGSKNAPSNKATD
jgi:hypothetical protein